MLPDAQPFTVEQAQRWRAAARPLRFVRTGLPLLWLLAVAASFLTPTVTCTPENPSLCGPDAAGSVWFTIFLATPLLLLWLPQVGCVAGIAYGSASWMYEPDQGPRISFGVYAAVCVVGLLWLRRALAAQEAVGRVAAGPRSLAPELTRGLQISLRAKRIALAIALLIAGLGLFGWYLHELREEDAHLKRSVSETLRVVELSEDDFTITVEGVAGLGDRTRLTIDVYEADDYQVGQLLPILLDPNDPSWVRLVSEGDDQGSWLGLAAGAWLWSALLVARELRRRRALQDLLQSGQPVIALRSHLNADINLDLLPADADGPGFARFITAWAEDGGGDDPELDQAPWDDGWEGEDVEAFGRYWRDEDPDLDDQEWDVPEPQESVLVGPLRYGAWPLLLVDEQLLLPTRPLTFGRDDCLPAFSGLLGRWFARFRPDREEETTAPDGEHESVGSVLLSPAEVGEPLSLPITARAPLLMRAWGLVMVVAGLIGGPAVVVVAHEDGDWFAGASWAFGVGFLLLSGVGKLVSGVTLTRAGLLVHAAGRTHHVPWDCLHGVRLQEDGLLLAWKPTEVVDVGPFGTSGAATARERARQLGAEMMRLREQSMAAGRPDREASSRSGPGRQLLAVYVLELAVTLWVIW